MKLTARELIAELEELAAGHGNLPVYLMADDYGWCGGAHYEPEVGKPYREDDVSPAIVLDT